MPELPEVQTTVDGLNRTVQGRTIKRVSTTYKSPHHKNKDNIKDPKFFSYFKKKVEGRKIIRAERRAKNILIHLSGGETILTHMKMTGFFFYNPPVDAKFIRLDFTLDNGKHLAFSDMRKFAKVTVIPTKGIFDSPHLSNLGPEPLNKTFTYADFKSRIMKRPRGKVKPVLMDQSILSGVGNIYADESLWLAGIHPLSIISKIPNEKLKLLFKAVQQTLRKGIDFGGDSTSDYRDIEGKPGRFQGRYNAYQKTGSSCRKRGCPGIIKRIMIGQRSAHFCPVHQTLFA